MPDGTPKKPRWRRYRRRRRDFPTVAEASRAMTEAYQGLQAMDIRVMDARRDQDLRRRADGQPSARPPAATLPVSYWATVLEPPDGYEDGGVSEKLAQYQEWLETWKDLGLYHGPTELTYDNPEPEPEGEGGA
jgi:hypothetical protein